MQNFGDLIVNLPDGEITQDAVEEALHLTGMTYYAETEMHFDVAGKISKVTWTREPSQAFLARDITVWVTWGGTPVFIKRASVGIDVKRTGLSYSSVTNNSQDEFAWKATPGSMGSATEHAVLEQLYNTEAVSSIKILALANKWGLPIYHINQDNIDKILPLLSAADIVKQNIIYYVMNYGWTVVIPQREIQLNLWRGQGWIVRDPTTGNSGYFIAGSLISGNDITAGGQGTDVKWANNVIKFGVLEALGKMVTAAGVFGMAYSFYAADFAILAALTSPIFIISAVMLVIGIVSIKILIPAIFGMGANLWRNRWHGLRSRLTVFA